ncbi:Oidioi.mRNA.OKI2018_I69.XSR.g13244.t1.cds [Oikopleura dioica]|uniref:Oidioi.mRNA.OKI2018_I69.XSR.g13244.t1.cds n=1 Tax=Oikopleura dioica TaxID=34765 RepID=A0ABN7S830_OIKDI|nr:Oidioi.mRNA.OKI2018_I69.XSR.g13244.t1.cds [Oikopleura dioica]
MERIKPYFPIFTWAPRYQPKEYLSRDIIAGLTVALTVVPQGLAYASLAKLPTEYGLYTSYVSAIVYTFMGSSKDLAVGPQSLTSMLTAQYCMRPETWIPMAGVTSESDPRLANLLCFCSGAIILLLGIFDLGAVVNYISNPVLVGFISAASIIIPFSLLERVFGLSGLPGPFYQKMVAMVMRLGESKYYDAIIGLSTLATLLALKHLRIHFADPKEGDSALVRILRKVLWIVATLRNAFVLAITSFILYSSGNNCPFADEPIDLNITDPNAKDCITPTTISAITLPPIAFPDTNIELENGESAGIVDMLTTLGSGIIIVPFVAILQSIGIGKSLAERGNYQVNARNDFLAIGTGGVMSSLVSSMPVSGCFSRSSLNFESNAATQAGNLITAVVVMISAVLLAEYFRWIPTAALAAVIMAAVGSMFDFDAIKQVWTLSKIESIPMIATFALSCVDFRIGIVVGIFLHIAMLLYSQNSPQITVVSGANKSFTIKIAHGIAFPVCETLLDRVNLLLKKRRKSTQSRST